MASMRAVRAVIRRPAYHGVLFLCMLGSALVASLAYSVLSAAALRPAPYEDPGHLYLLSGTSGDSRSLLPGAFVQALLERPPAGVAGTAVKPSSASLSLDERTLRAWAGRVPPNFFDVVRPRVEPLCGTGPTGPLATVRVTPWAVVSERLFSTLGGSVGGLCGRYLQGGAEAWQVVAVLPREFRLGYVEEPDLWLQVSWAQVGTLANTWGLLRTPSSGVPAAATVRGTARRLLPRAEAGDATVDLRVERLDATLFSNNRRVSVTAALFIVVVMVGIAFGIAALALAHSRMRATDTATRLAMGASFVQIARPMAAETLLVSVAGGMGGAALAGAALDRLVAALPKALTRTELAVVDTSAWVTGLAVAFLMGSVVVAARVWPTVRAGATVSVRRAFAAGQQAVQVLFAVQAVVVVLAVATACAALMSSAAVRFAPLGFHTKDLYVLRTADGQPGRAGTGLPPGVILSWASSWGAQVAFTSSVPLAGPLDQRRVLDTTRTGSNASVQADVRFVDRNYFGVLGLSTEGRLDTGDDHLQAAVSKSLATSLWGDGVSPLGRRLDVEARLRPLSVTITAVVPDVRNSGPLEEPVPTLYVHRAASAVWRPAAVIRARPGTRPLTKMLERGVPLAAVPITSGRRYLEAWNRFEFYTFASTSLAIVGLAVTAMAFLGILVQVLERARLATAIRMALGATYWGATEAVTRRLVAPLAAGAFVGAIGASWLLEWMERDLGLLPSSRLAVGATAFLLFGSVCAACLGARARRDRHLSLATVLRQGQ